ncbi:MAG: hypothetical protein OXT67_11130 [Zetaproteobacteria bacterium]|nr:hypothetical protein [Zetaproteobacteria bacterium]
MQENMVTELVRTRLESFQQLSQAKPYIGSEFLTWLWFVTESRPQEVARGFDVWIDDRLGLRPYAADGHETTFKGGAPAGSTAAQASLLSGHMVREVRVGMSNERYEVVSAVLHHKDLAPTSVLVREHETAELSTDQVEPALVHEAELLQKIEAVEFFCTCLDLLYQEFFNLRLSEAWHLEVLPAFRAWVIGRGKSRGPATLH